MTFLRNSAHGGTQRRGSVLKHGEGVRKAMSHYPFFPWSFVLFVCANKLLLRCLQDKAAKSILDRPLHSSSTDALKFLRWLNLEERRKCHRCIYAYKCINGQPEHSLDILRKSDTHSYNIRNKDTIKFPKIRCNWGKHRSRYHCNTLMS